MKSIVKAISIILFMVILVPMSYAAQPLNSGLGANGVNANPAVFKVSEANQEFDKIHIKLSIQNLNIDDLKVAVSRLQQLQNLAQRCVQDGSTQLKLAEDEYKTLSQANSHGLDVNYLKNKRDALKQQQAECRLFVLRSQEAIGAFNNTIQRVNNSMLFARGLPVWMYFQKDKTIISLFSQVDWHTIFVASGIASLLSNTMLLIAFIVLLSSVGITSLLQRFRPRIYLIFGRWHIVSNVFLLIMGTVFTALFWNVLPKPPVVLLFYGTLVYTLTLSLLRLSLFHLLPSASFFQTKNMRDVLHLRSVILSTVFLVAYLFYALMVNQPLPTSLIDTGQVILITVLSLNIVWIAWLYNRIPYSGEKKPRLRSGINIVLVLALIGILGTTFLGFDNLALFLLSAVGYSIILTFFTFIALKLINQSFDNFNRGTTTLSKNIRDLLGIKPYKRLSELFLLRFSAILIVCSVYLILLMLAWDFPPNTIDVLIKSFFNGISLTNSKIIPVKILIAAMVFPLLILFGRFITHSIKKSVRFENEKDTRVAVVSITSYVMFALSLIIALMISGVDLTSLAIITGALSVGIGLGLQSIVNNFVSGIILLLERPIKPGDRIAIGTTEGFVKKIRIRSTQITTTARADVIVPNSDLITHQITNYMFKDPSSRINCPVGVSYDSDIQFVKKLLLQIAHEHPDVLQDKESEPRVLFKEFGENSLLFELNCFIKDVNLKNQIKSDLNFGIAQIFLKHNLLFSAPQRDIHIKEWPAAIQFESKVKKTVDDKVE